MDTTTTERIAIGGLRFSSEQIQLSLSGFTPDLHDFNQFLTDLAAEKICLPFICFDTYSDTLASMCMLRDDFDEQQEIVDQTLSRYGLQPVLTPSTGSLTLFPHQSRLSVLGTLLEVFCKEQLPLYSLCSSISALVINTDYHHLDKTAQSLGKAFKLPQNHSPFRQKIKGEKRPDGGDNENSAIVETAAVYWEPVIKIYGSSVKKELLMISAFLTGSQLQLLASELKGAGSTDGLFEMVLLQRVTGDRYKLELLYESGLAESYRTLVDMCETGFQDVEQKAAELLYLHGPHFHDRYGVASAALTNLQMDDDDLFAVGCSGTSIYIITATEKAQQCAAALEKTFIVPKVSKD